MRQHFNFSVAHKKLLTNPPSPPRPAATAPTETTPTAVRSGNKNNSNNKQNDDRNRHWAGVAGGVRGGLSPPWSHCQPCGYARWCLNFRRMSSRPVLVRAERRKWGSGRQTGNCAWPKLITLRVAVCEFWLFSSCWLWPTGISLKINIYLWNY